MDDGCSTKAHNKGKKKKEWQMNMELWALVLTEVATLAKTSGRKPFHHGF